ncbi:hypothetical protein V6N13_120162 [Hibiscus sabdariffa]
MATSRWRGGPHDSIPCKQIGVVELAQAIHAVSGPGHLEVARGSTKSLRKPIDKRSWRSKSLAKRFGNLKEAILAGEAAAIIVRDHQR